MGNRYRCLSQACPIKALRNNGYILAWRQASCLRVCLLRWRSKAGRNTLLIRGHRLLWSWPSIHRLSSNTCQDSMPRPLRHCKGNRPHHICRHSRMGRNRMCTHSTWRLPPVTIRMSLSSQSVRHKMLALRPLSKQPLQHRPHLTMANNMPLLSPSSSSRQFLTRVPSSQFKWIRVTGRNSISQRL